MIKVLIAEDQELIRQSIEIMLNGKENINVVGTAANGRECIRQTRELRPDIILMDIRMPEVDGLKCLEIIKDCRPDVKVIVLTTFDDDNYILKAFKYGASGYLLKGISVKELVDSINIVYNGGALINQEIMPKVIKMFSNMVEKDIDLEAEEKKLLLLNKNEIEITKCIGKGMNNKEISEKTNFSEGTVRNYISSVLSKLELRDRTQIAIFAVEIGLNNKK